MKQNHVFRWLYVFRGFFFLMLYENNFNPEPRGSEEDEATKSSK